MEDDDETFISIGTPLEFMNEDEPIQKPQKELQAVGVGTKARPRFHGAFTGGFSAGYFNTVGSKDGFTPSSFTSSKDKKKEFTTQRPEDFMDDEDFTEHGIAPKKFQTSETFLSEDRKRRRDLAIKSATADTLFGSTTALADLIVPEKLTIGVKLLHKMGWKEGQGMGPRYERKKKSSNISKDSQRKVYGCFLPEEDSEESSDEVPENVTFAPRDVNPIKIQAKDNVHGIGYRGLDPRKALPGSHVNLFSAPAITKTGKRGIRGTAFGVGALEEEDEDIYGQDHLSNYDMTMDIEGDDHMGWTAPGKGKKHDVPLGYVGNLLEGFTLSGKKLPPRKIFPPPQIPREFRPVHTFINEIDNQDTSNKTEQDAISRGITLGETPVFESVFDLIPQKDKERLKTVKSRTDHTCNNVQTPSITGNDSSTTDSQSGYSKLSSSTSVVDGKEGTHQSVPSTSDSRKSPMSVNLQTFPAGRGAVFSPFIKDPDKQRRYDTYIRLVKEGNPDAYEEVAEGLMTEWEREREKEEFDKASKFYKPMAGMMASRFTRAKYHDDDDKVEMPAQEQGDKNDRQSAAKMKMYGPLTRDTYEWHPDRVVCKRFNIPDPYPRSTITGVPKVKRDKYTVFNFLNFSSNEPEEQKSTPQEQRSVPQESEIRALPAPEDKQDRTEGISFKINSSQSKLTTSIFSSLNEEKFKDLPPKTPDKEEDSRPSMDLFEAIFGNTDSEESDKEEQHTDTQQMDTEEKITEHQNKSQTDQQSIGVTRSIQSSAEKLESVMSEEYRKKGDKSERSKGGKPDTEESPAGKPAPPGNSIFSHLFKKPEKEEASCLPGAPVVIETVEKRLSGDSREESFGPDLPPSMKDQSRGSMDVQFTHKERSDENRDRTRQKDREKDGYRDRQTDRYRDRTRDKYGGKEGDHEKEHSRERWIERKEQSSSERDNRKDKHKKHKHTKNKKSKHKKKHKKEKKSHHRDKVTQGSSSDADSESDSDTPITNQELLQKFKSLSRSGKFKPRYLDLDGTKNPRIQDIEGLSDDNPTSKILRLKDWSVGRMYSTVFIVGCFFWAGVRSEELYVSTPTSILRVDTSTLQTSTIVTKENGRLLGLAADWRNQKIYYSDVSSNGAGIYESDLQGNNAKKLPIQYPDMEPVGLAVDWVYGHLYWTDTVYRSVMMSNLDGTGRITIVTENLIIPRGIAVDPKRRELYVGDQGNHAVQICGLDGRNCRELNVTDASATFWPNQITIDHVSSKVHWTDGWIPAIYSCSVGGSSCVRNTGNLSTELGSNPVFGIAVGQSDKLFLSTLHNQSLYKSSDSLELTSLEIPSSESKTFFLLSKETAISQPTVSTTNPCARNKGGCSDICVPHSDNTFTCACSDGSGKIPISQSCQSPSQFLLFTDVSRGIVGMSSVNNPDMQTTILRAVKPLAVTYHLVEKKVYFADARMRAIYKCNLDGSGVEALLNSSHGVGQVEGLSIDYNQNRLYFSNMGFEEYSGVVRSWHAIEMIDLGTRKRRTIVTEVEKPRALLVDSANRLLYYTDWGTTGHVGKVQLDGSNREVLFTAENPNDLAISDNKLLVINNKSPTPEMIELDLSSSALTKRPLSGVEPLSLAVSGNKRLISSFSGGMKIYTTSLSLSSSSNVGQFTRMSIVDTTVTKQPDGGLCSSSSSCSDICVTSPNSNYLSCLCPSDQFNIQTSDRLSCQKPEIYLLFADIDGIKMVTQGTMRDDHVYTIIHPSESCNHFYGLVIDRSKEYIYFSALQGNSIFRAKVDGSNIEKFVTDENSKITNLAIVGNDLFWTSTNTTDNSTGSIVHCNTANTDRTVAVLFPTASEPLDIAADESNIYWTERGSSGIKRYDRRTSMELRSVTSARTAAIALTDPSRHLLYATDSNVKLRRFPTIQDVSFLTDTINEADAQSLMATSKFLYLSRWRDNSTGSVLRHNLLTKTTELITNAAVRPGQMVYISSQTSLVQDKPGNCPSALSCSNISACSLDVDCYGSSKCCGTSTCTRCTTPEKGKDCSKNGIYIQNNGDVVVVDCESCSCINSNLTCTPLTCPDLGSCPADNQVKPPGSCCNECTATIVCSSPPTIENCPTSTVRMLLPADNDTVDIFLHNIVPESTYGKSCSGQKLDLKLTTTSIKWKRNVQPVVITATDKHGTATCSVNVHVIDNTMPALSCPSGTLQMYITENSKTVTWPPVTASDNSGFVTLTSNTENGVDRAVGLHEIRYEARDQSGNMKQCLFSVNVIKLLGCENPPIPFNGLLRCNDAKTLTCELEKCNDGYISSISNLQSHACDQTKGQWVPSFPDNFSNVCIKPGPSIIQREYIFEFDCPNSEFDAGDLRDCISDARLCPVDDITLCDRPFKRIGSASVSGSLLNITMRMEGTLPHGGDKSSLVNRMTAAGAAIEMFFQTGTFKTRCPKIFCPFKKALAKTDTRTCEVGSVVYNVANQDICAPCPAGWYYENGKCTECLPNTYQDRPGQTSCRACPDGTISSSGSFLDSHCKAMEKLQDPRQSQDNMLVIIVAVVVVVILILVVIGIVIYCKRQKSTGNDVKMGNFENPAFTGHGNSGLMMAEPVEEYDQIPADKMLSESQLQNHSKGVYESSRKVPKEDHTYQSLSGASNKGFQEPEYETPNKRLLDDGMRDGDHVYSKVNMQ
ncbi:uncharacterized protein LOC133196991 [Saccostrea echinata]|uniref:uncharacterized protein LOC133196991 n=1 Tax=Saccostrea echinata TaxID=191078 RepID=UPI002A82724B|nr:uncharacterized protein LOC133196991 [Saccostrea echinata]